MFKYILLILFVLLSFNVVLCDNITLPYTETSNFTKISIDYNNDNYTILTANENEIYEIIQYYKFGVLNVNEGIQTSNLSFINNYVNITISEKYNITDAFLSKKVDYELLIYENGILTTTQKNNYYVFTTSCFFAKTIYTFNTNEIIVYNRYADLKKFKNEVYYTLLLQKPLILDKIQLNFSTFNNNLGRNIWIEYIQVGVKPKSYYVKQLHPIIQLPYRIMDKWDSDNNILNLLLIISYLLKTLFFWIKVIYISFFTIMILILIGVIPFISLIQSNYPMEFINKLFSNYVLFINLLINIIKYTINLMIKLIELIPFI